MSDVAMIETRINGRWTLKLPEHRAARPEWVTGWEPERLDSMNRNIEPGDVVLDIGTEEGDMTALFAIWCGHGAGGEIHCFEPNQRVWPNIKAIFDANGIPAPAGCWTGFAGKTTDSGTPDEWRLPEDGLVRHGWPSCADGPVIGDHGFLNLAERPDVPVVSIDDYYFGDRLGVDGPGAIDVITMDVEGAEFNVLAGAQAVLALERPLIYVSIHDAFMAEMYDRTRSDIFDLMGDYGYRWTELAVDHEAHFAFWAPHGRVLR